MVLTNGAQKTRDGGTVSLASGLVLAQDTATNTLNNTDLGGLLVIKLAQAEGEGTELLDNLRQSLAGAGALQAVSGGGTAVQGSTVVEVLDLAGSETEANLNTPNFADLGDTVTADTVTGRENDLLLALNLVAAEQPAGGVLDDIAVVGLGDLLEQGRHVGLSRGLLSRGLLLLLVGTLSQQTLGNHETQEDLVGVVSSENEISLTAGNRLLGGVLLGNDHHVANDGSESIDLSTKLDLDDLAGLQSNLGLGGIGHQRSVGSHIGARGDSRGVRDTLITSYDQFMWFFCHRLCREGVGPTLDNLLALVDLGNLLLEELVTLLTNLDDLLSLQAKSYSKVRSQNQTLGFLRNIPETASRTL
jgi:hypothetical protein